MYRLNLVLMILLSSGVIGAGAYLALGHKASEDPAAPIRQLIRRLGDSDLDVRRDAEAALKKMGPAALPSLKSAASSSDGILAARAQSVIRQIEGAPVAPKPETPVEAHKVEEALPATVEATLECAQARIAVGEPVRLHVRLRNGMPQAVLVARRTVGGVALYGEFAAFEVTDAEGAVSTEPVDRCPCDVDGTLEFVAVDPATTTDLSAGHALGAALGRILSKPGTYRVRFVYDAGERSAYREAVGRAHPAGGVPLAPGRLASNTITLVVE